MDMSKQKLSISGQVNTFAHAKRLREEKLRLLFNSVWQPVCGGILASILLVILMWGMVDSFVLVSWLIAILIVSTLRLLLAYFYLRASNQQQQSSRWLTLFVLIVFLTGCVWGAGGVLMFDDHIPEQVVALSIVLLGVAAGCIAMLSAVWWMALFFILPIAIPLLLLFLFSDVRIYSMMGSLLTLFVSLLIATSYRLGRIIHENIELRVSMSAREILLLESENRYLSIFQHSPLGVLHFDKAGRVIDCNDTLLQILSLDRSKLMGGCMQKGADAGMSAAVQDALEKGAGYYEGHFSLPWVPCCKEGTPVRAFINGVRSVDDEIVGGVALIEDFTERKRSEEAIYRQAFYDSLTDLPNRRLFLERLTNLCDETQTEPQSALLMFLDIDHFKLINDTWGHATGDDLLVQVAKRLASCLREGDIAARLSGDEFVLLAMFEGKIDTRLEEHAAAYMCTVQQALSGPYALENRYIEITHSIGYTCFTAAACEHEKVLKQADVAMYRAKTEGRGRLSRYQPWM